MSIEYYIFIYTLLLSIILFGKAIKLREYYIVNLFSLIYLLNAFRIDTINDDAINYLFYFNDVSLYNSFESLLTSFYWVKIEIGFKLLLYAISKINLFDDALMYKIIISIVNIVIFNYLFISKIINNRNNNYLLFIFFYICSFLFIFDLAIIRFSISSLLLLVLFHKLIYTKYNKLTILMLYLSASSLHLGGMLFGFVFLYYYYIIKKDYNKLFIFFPFIIILIIVPLLIKFASLFGSYYSSMFLDVDQRISIRIIIESILVGYTFYKMKHTKSKKIFKLIFILYLFFAFIESYLGIMVLNRLRIITWLFFLYAITFVWKETKINFKIILFCYSLFFYFIQIFNISNNWE